MSKEPNVNMADVSKAQKLASARRKFKELKKEKKKNSGQKPNENNESEVSREQTPEIVTKLQETEPAPIPNYFNNATFNNGYQQIHPPAAFFDTFVQNDRTDSPLASAFTNFNNQTEKENTSSYQNEVFTIEPISDSPQEIINRIETPPDNNVTEIGEFQADDTVKLDQNLPELSPVESLRQISNQMAELIHPTSDFPQAVIESQLETRNQELAALLNQEKLKSEELSATLREYQTRIHQLESDLKEKELNSDNKLEQEVSSLREQLQCHVQTVGILVAEKTELVANLSQFQLSAKQKTEECDELQGRLKTSRSRVADLEREVALLKNEKSQYDNLGREQISELENLRKDYQTIKDERDELMQDLLEVREKLKSSSENNLVFQQQIGELSNQLSMANIKIQQLTIGEIDHASGQVEQLTQEKFSLEKQIADLTHTIKSITKERDESSLQYQQYAQQLNAQITNMAARLEKLQKENESLQVQEQNRIKHIGELEKQLQNIQNDQVNYAVQKPIGESRADIDAALELIEKLKSENAELQEESIKIANEKELLLKDLEGKNESIKELEELIEELKGNQPDSAKLLATMESDKIAASRAVSQNTELKKQMESMQEVFMKMNNDKIELIEKLSIEQRNSKELFDKLQKTELHLQTLADAIEIKDKELQHLRDDSLELDKKMLQSEQLTDRLRHFEAQDHSAQALYHDLQESKQIIAKLTAEIENLRHNSHGAEVGELKQKLEILELKNQDLEEKRTDPNHNDSLDRESAMKHLEAKFLKTMEDIATLTEEKQRLEHLVLQLQGETETIGEYIALYQQQRSLLKQKAIEKDQQLSQLANDREIMKDKLEKLNDLVRKLVLEKGAVPSELLEHHETLQRDNRLCEEHAKINNEINKITQNFTNEANGDSQSTETAEQIIALLSEIKSSNLIQPTENFHHCPWCSGQLITV